MGATRSEIASWFDRGAAQGAAFMIVWCDTFDYEDYPAYFNSAEEAQESLDKEDGTNMQKAMEVYDLNQPRDSQLKISKCWALTKGGKGTIRDVSLSGKIYPSADNTSDPKKLLEELVGSAQIAEEIVKSLGLKPEIVEPGGQDYLSAPRIIRWVTDWKAWRTTPK